MSNLNLEVILSLIVGVFLNVISSWIIVSKRKRVIFFISTIVFIGYYLFVISPKNSFEDVQKKENQSAISNMPDTIRSSLQEKQKSNLYKKPVFGDTAEENIQNQPDPKLFANKSSSLIIRDREGNEYPVFQFGKLVWLAKNLNITLKDNHSLCYDNDIVNANTYGKLYNLTDAKKACSLLGIKWRLPTSEEFIELFMSNNGGYYEILPFREKKFGNPKRGLKNLIVGPLKGFNIQYGGQASSIFGNYDFTGLDSSFWYLTDNHDGASWIPYFLGGEEGIYLNRGHKVNFDSFKTSCRCVIDSAHFFGVQ